MVFVVGDVEADDAITVLESVGMGWYSITVVVVLVPPGLTWMAVVVLGGCGSRVGLVFRNSLDEFSSIKACDKQTDNDIRKFPIFIYFMTYLIGFRDVVGIVVVGGDGVIIVLRHTRVVQVIAGGGHAA